jgi:Concanavalin A-like lectin/glucanases superfamily
MTMIRRLRTQTRVTNGLLNALIAYWPGNEASGNALDAHTNALHLTDTNTVTSNPGKVYALARQYTAATSERHRRVADDALLSSGDVDFTLAAWCYLDSMGAARGIASKANSANGDYRLHVLATDNVRFKFFNSGVTRGTVDSTAVLQLATWHLVIGWHDSVADRIYVQIDNGTVNSNATTGVPGDGTDPFQIGWDSQVGYWNGRVGPTMFWKSAAGMGGALSAAQRTALWNGGAGLPYAAFTL